MDHDFPKIDEVQYQAGLDAYKAGATVRSVIAYMQNPASEDGPAISFAIGFIDGILEAIRK